MAHDGRRKKKAGYFEKEEGFEQKKMGSGAKNV
jgi:hypothetical protein